MQRWRTAAAAVAAVCASAAGIAGAADLPASVRQSATANLQAAAIEKYVKAQVDLVLTGGKAGGVAREELSRQTDSTPVVTPSANFNAEYVKSVMAQLDPLLKDTTDKGVHARLNAAIVVARISRSTHFYTPQLKARAEQMLADPSSAVALWGAKAAAELLPQAVAQPFNRKAQTLTGSLVASVGKHPDAGALVQTVYDALNIPVQTPPLPPDAYVPSIDAMDKLLALRTLQYVAALPAAPQAERVAPNFFIRDIVTKVMTPPQQLAAVQHLLNVMSLAAQHTATVPSGDTRQQVINLMTSCAGGLDIMFLSQNQLNVSAKFKAIAKLKDPIKTPDVVKQIADALAEARKLPAFKTLQDAPTIQAPATQTSAPSPSAAP